VSANPEVAWFWALCDDDYEFLGVPDPSLRSSWAHCRDIVTTAEANGFDNVLLPSGYALGIEACRSPAGSPRSPSGSSCCSRSVAARWVRQPDPKGDAVAGARVMIPGW
jgi:hypothetical protein